MGEKINYIKSNGKVFSERGLGLDLSYLRLRFVFMWVVRIELERFLEVFRRWNWLDFMVV